MSVEKVVLYTKSYCPFSKECKAFLKEKKIDFREKVIDGDKDLETEMHLKCNERTDTPQVLINSHHIGSFDDLKALDASGKLQEVLNS